MSWTKEHTALDCKCGKTACMFCDGGLFACTRCDSFEGGTTTHCPGEKMDADQRDNVYKGRLDFRDGAWIGECSPHTPAFWCTAEGYTVSLIYALEGDPEKLSAKVLDLARRLVRQAQAQALYALAEDAKQLTVIYDQDSDDGWREVIRKRAAAIAEGKIQ